MFNSLRNHARNILGWRTKHKIVVFEVDDYGSIRMPSPSVYQTLLKAGAKVDQSRFTKYDSLEDADDLSQLFDVLTSVKDVHGNPAVFTPLCVVANPDFGKIAKDDFEAYHYELLPQTFSRYFNGNATWELWKEGVRKRIFLPEFHGREHLNVSLWMEALKAGHKATRLAFEHGTFGLRHDTYGNRSNGYMAAFDFSDSREIPGMKTILVDGLRKFEELVSYKAQCFTPPNAVLAASLEQTLAEHGVRAITVGKVKNEPLGNGQYRKSFKYIGQRNAYGQRYITRNCLFEPGANPSVDWVDRCLGEIHYAFKWRKPAIISSHRVNFIGSLDPANRDRSLKDLKNLLFRIVHTWPDVQFHSSASLVNLMK